MADGSLSDVLNQIMPILTTVLNMFVMIYLLKTLFSIFKEFR